MEYFNIVKDAYPYELSVGLIWIVILCLVIAAVALFHIYIKQKEAKAYEIAVSIVRENSYMYQAICEMNRITPYYRDVKPEYHFYHNCTSRQTYDSFNYDKYAEELIIQYGDKRDYLIKKCKNNTLVSNVYYEEFDIIMAQESNLLKAVKINELIEKKNRFLTMDLVCEVEKKLCKDAKKKIISTPKFIIHNEYKNPQEKSDYSDTRTYSIRDLQNFIDRTHHKETKTNTYTYKRKVM